MDRILVIKLGALGDFIQALGPLAAIRDHHAAAHIVLLTTAPYRDFAEASGYVDEVWLDTRPSVLDLPGLFRLRQQLRQGRFDRVYDLQTSDRSGWYYRLIGPEPRPQWSGIARGASYPHANPARDRMHTRERLTEQLAMAGIADTPEPDLSWAVSAITIPRLKRRYALLAPGASPRRPEKRWPATSFAAVAAWLGGRSIQPVVIGSGGEKALAGRVLDGIDGGLDLTGRTDLLQLSSLGRGAALALGNDTGPMHLFAALGTPTIVLFSAASDPALTAPRGRAVKILRRPSLAALSVAEVVAACPVD